MEQDTIVMQDIYRYVQDGIDEMGRAFGPFRIRPACVRNSCTRLESAGVRLPASDFPSR